MTKYKVQSLRSLREDPRLPAISIEPTGGPNGHRTHAGASADRHFPGRAAL